MTKIFLEPGDINLFDPAQVADPCLLPALAQLRESDPVSWSPTMGGWIVSGYAEVAAAYKDRRISNDRVPAFAFAAIPSSEWNDVIPNLSRGVENWVVNMDRPRHMRVRSLLLKAFTARLVDDQRELIESLCEEATTKAEAMRTFDFMRDIVFPVPAKLILTLLGIPFSYLDDLADWNRRVSLTVQTKASRETLLDGEAAIAALNSVLRVEIEKRRIEPRNDFLSSLISISDGEGRLDIEELLSICQVLMFAGQDTTVNSICLGMLAFLEHPDQLALFLSGEVDPVIAMNEVTRYTAMSTCMFKIAAEDFVMSDKKIKGGDVIFIMTAAANHDPSAFPEPDKFDLRRENLENIITFAPGIHMCIGHYLARLEMAVFFRHFLNRFNRFEILDHPVRFQDNFVFRGLEHLNMRVP